MREYFYQKKVSNYDISVLNRVVLMKQTSKVCSIFPDFHFEIRANSIIQYCKKIKAYKWPSDTIELMKLWKDFRVELEKMHRLGYVHGDILKKNIIFDGHRLRLIDHELSLRHNSQLRVTYPWVSIDDLIAGKVTQKTDQICIKATELRITDDESYRRFRKEQELKLEQYFITRL